MTSTEGARLSTQSDCVVTHHWNTFASGVVRFNEILAERLEVPLVGLFSKELENYRLPLLSFKAIELTPEERDTLQRRIDRGDQRFDVYLHNWDGSKLEVELVRRANRVWCGNSELFSEVADLNPATECLWTPGLLLDHRRFNRPQLSVFSFGMAHKIRTKMFGRLRALLEQTEMTYALYVSSANHETKTIRDAQVVFEEMDELFPEHLYFMGNLSDVAVYNMLDVTTFFAAFFERGVRANNTSVAAAMEQGAVVITNLDQHSPPHLRHMENVIDINTIDALPTDPAVLARIGHAAREAASSLGWDALASKLRRDPRQAPARSAPPGGS